MNKTFVEIPENVSLEDKIAMLKQNNLVASEIRGEMIISKKIITPIFRGEYEKNSSVNTTLKGKDIKVDKVYNEIALLPSDNCDELLNSMREILLGLDNYTELFDELKVRLYEEIVLYANLAFKDREAIKDIREIIDSLRLKLSLLDSIEEQKEKSEISLENNKLLFLETNALNIVLLESIRKNIPIEYYKKFKSLLESIANGSFKNFKRLRNGLYEVKLLEVRILFGILKKGHYLILDAFMKKEDTSAYYKSLISNRLNQYLKFKSYYLQGLDNEEFLLKHEEYLANIMDLLNLKNSSELRS